MDTGCSKLPAELRGLMSPSAYPHPVQGLRLVETNLSWVLLTGEFAYKLKRPVRLAFVDQSSLAQREFLCREELRLNRRFTPEMYLEVCPVTRGRNGARIGGRGAVIAHAVRMRQFAAQCELAQLLGRGLDAQALSRFGADLVGWHAQLRVAQENNVWGRSQQVRALILENFEQARDAMLPLGRMIEVEMLRAPLVSLVDALATQVDARRRLGRVRECHGDLHIGNVMSLDGRLRAFDGVEFDAALRWMDVADEVSFLYMDLVAHGYPLHARRLLEGYLSAGGDYGACRVLPLYTVHRALVRAKVEALRAGAAVDRDAREYGIEHIDRYLAFARAALLPRTPRLIAMCGLSGSGKSWLATRLADRLGAVTVASDLERKRLAGLREHDRSGAALEQGLYSSVVTAGTYRRLAQCADDAVGGGFDVIVDATFRQRETRAQLRQVAARHGLTLELVHCAASPQVLESRIVERGRGAASASDADLAVLAWQRSHFDDLRGDEGLRVIEADTTRGDVEAMVLGQLGAAQRVAACGPGAGFVEVASC